MTGPELKALRLAKGLTQKQLAQISGLADVMTISDYENGKVRITKPMSILFTLLLK